MLVMVASISRRFSLVGMSARGCQKDKVEFSAVRIKYCVPLGD